MSNQMNIMVCIKKDTECITEWMTQMRMFCPKRMCMRQYTKGKTVSYREKVFLNELKSEIENANFAIRLGDGENRLCSHSGSGSEKNILLTALFTYEIFSTHEEEIYSLINKIMNGPGIVARIVSSEDWFWQNNLDLNEYKRRGRSLEGIPLKPHPVFEKEKAVDVEQLPGYEELVDNIWFGAAWKMWFHDVYYQYIYPGSIEDFRDCSSNMRITDTCRCIALYDDVFDYDKPENRERQVSFKKAIHFKESLEKIKKAGKYSDADPQLEITNGDFAHGGVKRSKIYLDDQDNNVSKSKASKVRIMEFDRSGKLVWEDIEILKRNCLRKMMVSKFSNNSRESNRLVSEFIDKLQKKG